MTVATTKERLFTTQELKLFLGDLCLWVRSVPVERVPELRNSLTVYPTWETLFFEITVFLRPMQGHSTRDVLCPQEVVFFVF